MSCYVKGISFLGMPCLDYKVELWCVCKFARPKDAYIMHEDEEDVEEGEEGEDGEGDGVSK